MFAILSDFVKWVLDACLVFNSTEEGRERLTVIADALEAAGVDIPFYEPSENPLNMQAQRAPNGNASERDASFRSRHPELFPEEGVQS